MRDTFDWELCESGGEVIASNVTTPLLIVDARFIRVYPNGRGDGTDFIDIELTPRRASEVTVRSGWGSLEVLPEAANVVGIRLRSGR